MARIYKSRDGERAVRERYQAFLKRWPVANRQFYVPTRQGDTFVVASGTVNAPPVVLLHGSAANSAMWMGDIAAWSVHFHVYAVDMIGEPGLSTQIRPPLKSDAHALWLDDVMRGLCINRASFVGVSLGGWVGLDYATRRPEKVASLAVLCPGGVGRQKLAIAFKAAALRMCGPRGARRLREMILGHTPANLPPAVKPFMDFVALIHENFRPRMVKMPVFSDEMLKRLTMPVMAIVGGKDVLLDSAETKRRLEQNVPHADVRFLPDAGHMLPPQTRPILDFLCQSNLA